MQGQINAAVVLAAWEELCWRLGWRMPLFTADVETSKSRCRVPILRPGYTGEAGEPKGF